ncbi:hypothetical protein AC578_363 [Pseudocercospora eumusae]|uniref:Uncharacterized protein n=1 Tax=Pseudocercospora eumusae TaxID=321146 RepID=A0A139HUA0_9PEZI|nr:hypothetical protein AC578_363 [Pseudocercospora eumusae]
MAAQLHRLTVIAKCMHSISTLYQQQQQLHIFFIIANRRRFLLSLKTLDPTSTAIRVKARYFRRRAR